MGLRDLLDTVRATLRLPSLPPLPLLPGRMRREEPVPAGQLPDVASVVAALRALDTELDRGDGVWHFNRMYLQVTELVEQRLHEGYFADDRFMERLDVVFAQLYLDAVHGDRVGLVPPPCWEPVLASRRTALAPIQFAVAGMNAHINHDLPVAVVTTCRQLGIDPTTRQVRSDYDKVSAVLAEVHEQVRQSFLDGIALEVDRELTPLLTLVGSWSVARAREAAWVNSEVLWALRAAPLLQEEFRASLSRTVGLVGRTLLVQVAEPV
ncbi:DUF5995 family protein [Ornithinimicrobium flavum]|uniref:DUF5995 family protein n=1 Tax=Ornithinimicrobium flavum TaxID=1288636 RepID=UPI00106FE6E9|nr:DUF5995 family protein [Ornithinimicrobium flavum]